MRAVLAALLLLVSLVAGWAAPAHAAVARTLGDWDEPGGSGTTHVYTSTGKTLTAGRLVEGMAAWSSAAESVSSIVDNKGNTYTIVDDVTVGTHRGVSFYAKNILGGADPIFTITFTGTVSDRRFGYRELSGADTTSPLVANDANAQATPGTGTNAITSTAQTPSADNAFISGWSTGFPIIASAGTGFSLDADIGFPAGETLAAEHLIQTSAASVAATFTSSGSPADTLTFLMAFQPTVAGGSNKAGPLVNSPILKGLVGGGLAR